MAARCVTEAFSTTCAVYIEDCEGWWLSGCRGSVAEHWQLKPEVSWVRLPMAAGLFHFFSLSSIFASLHPSSFTRRARLDYETNMALLSSLSGWQLKKQGVHECDLADTD